MTAVRFEQVSLKLGGRTILTDADFTIHASEFVGLLGPNGAGKTTLLRAILGLIKPDGGTIRVLDRPAKRGNHRIGYLPQHRSLTAGQSLTGWDYLASAVGGWRWGMPALSASEKNEIIWALDTVGASDLARRPLGRLSGGERQRLLISQALLGKPKLLLLDEPLINLDPKYQQGIVDLVKRLQMEFGIAVIFSAHELNPLLNAIDRVMYVGQRQVVLGEVDDVVTGPVLSKLYGSEIEVLRTGSRLFVLSSGINVESEAHRHDCEVAHFDRLKDIVEANDAFHRDA